MLKVVFIVLGALLLLFLAYWALVFYWLATKQSYREIARDVLISTDWLDIQPGPPLKVKHDVQHVYLAIEGYKHDLEDPLIPITLEDGTTLNPEIQVIDEDGRVYKLKGLAIVGTLVGFRAKFPRDGVYTRVMIRGDKPFRCSNVYWECSRMK